MLQTLKVSLKIVLNTVLLSNKYNLSQNYLLNVYFTAEAAICSNCQKRLLQKSEVHGGVCLL